MGTPVLKKKAGGGGGGGGGEGEAFLHTNSTSETETHLASCSRDDWNNMEVLPALKKYHTCRDGLLLEALLMNVMHGPSWAT